VTEAIFSIRMRASLNAAHISGAERLVDAAQVADVVQALAKRAISRVSTPDEIAISIDPINPDAIAKISALKIVPVSVSDPDEGRAKAVQLLTRAGVDDRVARESVLLLASGASQSGANMRGAVIMDSRSGARLEPDRERGIRVSRFDWSPAAVAIVRQKLDRLGLSHFRTYEALALASKVAHAPGVLAELCWSDEPEYTAGYVASRDFGYARIPSLKKAGDGHGGRVFFVDASTTRLDVLIEYLEREPVLIEEFGE
jgi:6-carboxyhexanoate--CoA ligase